MSTLKLPEQQLQAIKDSIRSEVQAQLRAQIKGLERRVAILEAQSGPGEPLSLFATRSCCDMSATRPPGSGRGGYSSMSQFQRSSPHEFLAVGNKEEEEPASEEQLPESMYNYCMSRLAMSPQPLHEPALMWWMLLFVVQFITMAAFCVCNDLENNAIGAVPADERDRSVVNCMLTKSDIFGTPLMKYGIGYVAIFIVASVMRNDDVDSLAAHIPQQENNLPIRLVGRFAWFWQAVYMPGCFGLEAATMFASSPDPLGVVTNTLAVTFIMEIDNMIYRNCLPESEKMAYQQLERASHNHPHNTARCSWALFSLNMVTMIVLFTQISITIGSGNLTGQPYLNQYWFFLCPLYLVCYGGRFFLQSLFSDPSDTRRLWLCLFKDSPGTAVAAVSGILMYIFSTNLAVFYFLFPPFKHFQANHLQSCMN